VKKLMGIDIGGTKCAVILGRMENNTLGDIIIVDKTAFPTKLNKGLDDVLGSIFAHIDAILTANKWKAHELYGIGISCGGPLDSKKGIIVSPPNLIGWDNVPIVEIFEKRYKIKTKLQNDANACALAEWKFGAGKGFRNIIFLTFGTGIGAGLILDGRLYSGTNGMAGEVGHIRLDDNGPVGYGKSGSFEGFCSGGGIAQLARIRVLEKLQMRERVSLCDSVDKLDELDAKTVGEAAENGNELAQEIYRESGRYLGKGLSILIDILNPEIIVIGGIFSRRRELLWPEAHEVIKRECLNDSQRVCRVVPSDLGEEIGDYAALAVALNG
jgi:glucokinase